MKYNIIPLFTLALFLIAPASSFAATVPAVDLTIGSRGQAVTQLQTLLIEVNAGSAAGRLSAAGATGYFGQLTRSALAEYQAAHAVTPAVGYFGVKTRAALTATIAPPQQTSTFTGAISAVDTSCFSDGVCSVTVDGKKVILTSGLRMQPVPPVGSLKGVASIGDLQSKIGSMARVYPASTSDAGAAYTLYGSTNYYVQVLNPVVPPNGPITVRGTLGCLPFRNTGDVHIALCGLGLAGEDGNYYALKDSSSDYSTVMQATGSLVEVTGTFTAETSTTFASIGTILVTQVLPVVGQ